jgi:hypothetical protein
MIRALLTALAVLATAFCQAQEVPAERLDAVKEFTRYFKKFKEEALQVEAVMTLKGNECRPAAEELLKLLKHANAGVQQAALAVLETYRDPATWQQWIDELPKQKDMEQIALLLKVLGRARLAGAIPAIEAAAADAKATPAVRFEAARALQAIGQPGTAGLLGRLVGDADPLVRLAAAEAIGALKVAALGAEVARLLNDPEWQVQTVAITALAALRPQAAVQPLIDLMRKTGRLRTECAEALFRITGFDFGVDPDRWQDQWTKLMAIPGWRIPTDEELAKKAEARKRSDAYYGKKDEQNVFAGIPTTSTRVLFIIDVSSSMDDLVTEVEKFQNYRDRRRFTVVQTELLNTVEQLTPDTYFDIVSFATDVHPWKKRLVQANVVNREAAKTFVQRLKPIGGGDSQDLAAAGLGGAANLSAGKTNTLKALLYAFGIDPENPPKATLTGGGKAALRSELDTVYFLSDGRPSVGKLVDTREILAAVRRHNETFRYTIHTIAIGEFQKDFLRELAEQNGGVFVDLGR